MKQKRIKVEREKADGWSRWVQPAMRGYLLSCCDCGLVHRLDFRIVGPERDAVQFRAQRAQGYTLRERRRRNL